MSVQVVFSPKIVLTRITVIKIDRVYLAGLLTFKRSEEANEIIKLRYYIVSIKR